VETLAVCKSAVTTDMRIMVGIVDDLRLIKVPTP